MLVNERHEISSCDDVELGIKRSSLLEFHLAYDDSKEAKSEDAFSDHFWFWRGF